MLKSEILSGIPEDPGAGVGNGGIRIRQFLHDEK